MAAHGHEVAITRCGAWQRGRIMLYKPEACFDTREVMEGLIDNGWPFLPGYIPSPTWLIQDSMIFSGML
jgi:hypothetical protein